jgi:hypothetical protein
MRALSGVLQAEKGPIESHFLSLFANFAFNEFCIPLCFNKLCFVFAFAFAIKAFLG